MNTNTKPSIETLEAAIGEFSSKGKVETVRCERCNELLVVERKSESVLTVRCSCGQYNDNLRGL